MIYRIYFLLIIMSQIMACQNAESAMEEKNEQPESDFIEILRENDKVKTGTIHEKEVERMVLCTGKIKIPHNGISSIHAKSSGRVGSFKYHEGDFVKKGTVLTRIENPQLLEKQRIFLETKALLRQAEMDFKRKKILKENKATSERTFEEIRSRFELLEAKYTGLKMELKAIGINVESLEKESQFQVSIPVISDQSGYVHEIFVNRGQMITPETSLMEVVNVDKALLELNVLSQDIDAISKGQNVEFTLPNRAETFNAEVRRINPMIEPNESSLRVLCSIDNDVKTMFVGGLFVNAKIIVEPKKHKGLPLSAVIKEGEDYFAYKIIDSSVEKTLLHNAIAQDDFIIFDGNKDGQWITEGAYYVEN